MGEDSKPVSLGFPNAATLNALEALRKMVEMSIVQKNAEKSKQNSTFLTISLG